MTARCSARRHAANEHCSGPLDYIIVWRARCGVIERSEPACALHAQADVARNSGDVCWGEVELRPSAEPVTCTRTDGMTVEQWAGVLHAAAGTLSAVAFVPRSCNVCANAARLHATWSDRP